MGRILIKKRKKEMGITVDKSSLNYNHNNLKKTYNRYRNPRSLTIMLFTGLTLCGIIIYLLIAGQTETESSAVSENALKDFEINSRFHTYEVLYEYPHDREAFTQGLEYSGNDTLYESTGLNGRSSVREVNLQTGKVQRLHQMKDADFGEGLTLLAERLFQLTWLTNVGYIYDQFNFSKVKRFRHPMKDGWGLANDGKNLFGSDGSSTMYYLDPVTFKERYRVTVKYEGLEVFHLNELEFINGEVWANVWQSDCIARISPKDGIVLGWILFHKLRKNLISSGYKSLDVLNGIAWDKGKGRLFVTGKLWPKLYQIKVRPLSQQEIKNLVWSSVFNILSFSAFTQYPSLKEYALLQFLVNLLHEGPKR